MYLGWRGEEDIILVGKKIQKCPLNRWGRVLRITLKLINESYRDGF
jgi:hypothetical protein